LASGEAAIEVKMALARSVG